MLWWLIPLIVIAICLAVIGAVFVKKIPDLHKIDVEALPRERMRQVKEELIMQRFSRMRTDKLGRFGKLASGAVQNTSKLGRRMVQKVYAMEQYYQKVKAAPADGSHAVDSETVKRLLDEAAKYALEEDFIQAEKRYIEVISHHPKHVDAYEGLGNLYVRAKQYDQARETLQFTARLSSDNASVQTSLADLEFKTGNYPAAVVHIRKAVEKRPNNPKFLDLYIESSIAAKMKDDAKKGLAMLKEANPENQKIATFKAQIDELPAASSQTT